MEDQRKTASSGIPIRTIPAHRSCGQGVRILSFFAGARILQATTISGTMVLGLAPVFDVGLFLKAPSLSFHLAFWTGIAVGIVEVLGLIPGALHIGKRAYASLLGANLWRLVLATALFLLPVAWEHIRDRSHPEEPDVVTADAAAPASSPAGVQSAYYPRSCRLPRTYGRSAAGFCPRCKAVTRFDGDARSPSPCVTRGCRT